MKKPSDRQIYIAALLVAILLTVFNLFIMYMIGGYP